MDPRVDERGGSVGPLKFQSMVRVWDPSGGLYHGYSLLYKFIRAIKTTANRNLEEIRAAFGGGVYAADRNGMHTIEQVLVRTIFHEGLHLETILAMKKHMLLHKWACLCIEVDLLLIGT